MRWAHIPRLGCLSLVVLVGAPHAAGAQLISPGRLARPHAELEGIRHCTSCHQLGRAGVSAERCLGCHTALADRVRVRRGYHADLGSASCSDCHQDHLGEGFALVRLDEASFDHAETGYELELGHAGVDCRDCHTASNVGDSLVIAQKSSAGALGRTYLGLSADCSGCHASDSPHAGQFGSRGCAECHDTGRWAEANVFNHSVTSFPLGGLHRTVSCAACHGSGPTSLYRLSGSERCGTCHADPHRGAMHGTCAGCHTTDGWHALRDVSISGAFDHARTAFALRGAHAAADCIACHRRMRPASGELVRISYRPGTEARSYPLPIARSCASCHVDRHAFPRSAGRWLGCGDCHSEAAWAPSAFGLAGHESTSFPLTGAHRATPCVACHQESLERHDPFQLALPGRGCADCHTSDDPHGGRYDGVACEACHVTDAFDAVAFDHGEGAIGGRSCPACHATDDPHGDQFAGRACSSCHGTASFEITSFDHSATRFALDGAHAGTACEGCHRSEPIGATDTLVRYRPLGTACTDCHGGVDAR